DRRQARGGEGRGISIRRRFWAGAASAGTSGASSPSALALSGCTQYSPLYRIKHERWRGGMDPAEGHEGGGVDPHRRIDRDRTAVSRIRDAALSEFAAHGVARATMRSVAEAAGVSAQLVVHHFGRSEEHTSELQSRFDLVCRLLRAQRKQ